MRGYNQGGGLINASLLIIHTEFVCVQDKFFALLVFKHKTL